MTNLYEVQAEMKNEIEKLFNLAKNKGVFNHYNH